MATDKTATWSEGESVLWYNPTTGLDHMYFFGESAFLDETSIIVSGSFIPHIMCHHFIPLFVGGN